MNEIAPLEQFSEAPVVEACARAPVGLLAELTHRCPLQCPYCVHYRTTLLQIDSS